MARSRIYRPRPLALACVRVSTAEQATEGASVDAQRAALDAEPSLVTGPLAPETLEDFSVQVEGDLGAVIKLIAALDARDPDFAIVTP